MSTADSALLSISSMLTKDIYAGFINRSAAEAELTRLGKRLSWGLITALVILAIALKEKASLVSLLDRKFDILVQLVPAFMLGIHWQGLQRTPVLAGLIAGLAVALVLAFGPFDFVVSGKIAGLHPGLFGLALNLLIAVGGSLWLRRGRVVHPGVRR
jgi:SSS family solute:Na+ symporter/sodium/pantothenate symporter